MAHVDFLGNGDSGFVELGVLLTFQRAQRPCGIRIGAIHSVPVPPEDDCMVHVHVHCHRDTGYHLIAAFSLNVQQTTEPTFTIPFLSTSKSKIWKVSIGLHSKTLGSSLLSEKPSTPLTQLNFAIELLEPELGTDAFQILHLVENFRRSSELYAEEAFETDPTLLFPKDAFTLPSTSWKTESSSVPTSLDLLIDPSPACQLTKLSDFSIAPRIVEMMSVEYIDERAHMLTSKLNHVRSCGGQVDVNHQNETDKIDADQIAGVQSIDWWTDALMLAESQSKGSQILHTLDRVSHASTTLVIFDILCFQILSEKEKGVEVTLADFTTLKGLDFSLTQHMSKFRAARKDVLSSLRKLTTSPVSLRNSINGPFLTFDDAAERRTAL